jgi:hypothetical protein
MKNYMVQIGKWRFIWIRGEVIELGPWRDSGYASMWLPDRAIIVKWWSFGRLFIERHDVVMPS